MLGIIIPSYLYYGLNTVPSMHQNTQIVSTTEYVNRRNKLLELLPERSCALVASAPESIRNADTHYPFRQHSHLLYLLGFTEPEALLVLQKTASGTQTILFCRERDPTKEQWTGKRLGPERATKQLGVDVAHPIGAVNDLLPSLLTDQAHLYYSMDDHSRLNEPVRQWLVSLKADTRDARSRPGTLHDLEPLIGEMRLHKSSDEIALMQCAGQITAAAHNRAMRNCKTARLESDLEAEILHEFAIGGARHAAYPSIVASGENACILHYTANDQPLEQGDLVLIDAGCEYQGYASDLTRTFPVSGSFTPAQKDLYEIVLAAQQAAIDQAQDGRRYTAMQQASDLVLTEGLVELGILAGDPQNLLQAGAQVPFTVHRVGHWLGLDVHDVGEYRLEGEPRKLAAGMVTTVEPGLYIPKDCKTATAEIRGTGIRIEDAVAITFDKPHILTIDAVKTVADIEALINGA